jgi:hypothetical protein
MLSTLIPQAQFTTGGGGDDPKKQSASLSPQEMQEWNAFIKFVKGKGMSGSKDLDNRNKNLGQQLFNEFKQSNPNVSISYDVVPRAQAEFQKFKQWHDGFQARKNGQPAPDQFDNLSKEDGWFGSLTSQQELIPMEMVQKGQGGAVTGIQNLGLMNGLGQPINAPVAKRSLPRGVKLERLRDAGGKEFLGYEDQNGDIVPYEYIN